MAKRSNVSAPEVIAEALTLLGPRGKHWITGVENDKHDNYCMIGALDAAASNLKASQDVKEKAFIAVARQLPEWEEPRMERDMDGRFLSSCLYDCAIDEIPDFNDALESDAVFNEDGSVRKSRRPPGFKHVRKVMCRAVKAQMRRRKRR